MIRIYQDRKIASCEDTENVRIDERKNLSWNLESATGWLPTAIDVGKVNKMG